MDDRRHASHRAWGKPEFDTEAIAQGQVPSRRMLLIERGADAELHPGVPVVQMLHIDYAPEGRTLQVADDLYAADRHEFALRKLLGFEPRA